MAFTVTNSPQSTTVHKKAITAAFSNYDGVDSTRNTTQIKVDFSEDITLDATTPFSCSSSYVQYTGIYRKISNRSYTFFVTRSANLSTATTVSAIFQVKIKTPIINIFTSATMNVHMNAKRTNNTHLGHLEEMLAASQMNAGKTVSPTTYTLGSFASSANKWWGALLAPNGNIYASPVTQTAMLKINTVSDTVTTFGSITDTNRNYERAFVGHNGKLYFIAWNNRKIIEVDPSNDSLTLRTPTGLDSGTATAGYEGGISAMNGETYIWSQTAAGITTGTIYKLNLDTFAATAVATFTKRPSPYLGWTDGKVYGGSLDGAFTSFDPSNNQIISHTSFTTSQTNAGNGIVFSNTQGQWLQGNLVQSFVASNLPWFNMNTKTFNYAGVGGAVNYPSSWVSYPDGNAYMLTSYYTWIARLYTEANNAPNVTRDYYKTNVGSATNNGSRRAILAPNGKIYTIPHTDTQVRVFNPGISGLVMPSIDCLTSSWFNMTV